MLGKSGVIQVKGDNSGATSASCLTLVNTILLRQC